MRALTLSLVAFSQWMLVEGQLRPILKARGGQTYDISWEGIETPVYVAGIYVVAPPIGALRSTSTVQQVVTPSTIPCTEAGSMCWLFATPTPTSFQLIESGLSLSLDVLWTTTSVAAIGATLSILSPEPITSAGEVSNPRSNPVKSDGTVSPQQTPTSTTSPNGSSMTSGLSAGPANGVGSISTSTGLSDVSSGNGSGGGLSTGAIVGIAIGAVGAFLIALIVALLIWRRQRKLKALPGGTMGYTDDRGSSMNRDLNAEKDMQIMSSPVGAYASNEAGHNPSYPGARSPEPQHPARADAPSPSGSWARNDQRGSYDALQGDSQVPPQVPTPPTAAMAPPGAEAAASSSSGGAPGFSRRPVAGPAPLFQEPGMSDEEVARLEEEERRIDEAIAEAERRRK